MREKQKMPVKKHGARIHNINPFVPTIGRETRGMLPMIGPHVRPTRNTFGDVVVKFPWTINCWPPGWHSQQGYYLQSFTSWIRHTAPMNGNYVCNSSLHWVTAQPACESLRHHPVWIWSQRIMRCECQYRPPVILLGYLVTYNISLLRAPWTISNSKSLST